MARKSRKDLSQNPTTVPKEVKYDAWGYTRISNDGERSEDSIESQTAIIKDYVSDKADIDLQNVITDLGFSGTDFLRPGYAELMCGIQDGKVQCVIVKDLSRVGRTYIEVGEGVVKVVNRREVLCVKAVGTSQTAIKNPPNV